LNNYNKKLYVFFILSLFSISGVKQLKNFIGTYPNCNINHVRNTEKTKVALEI